LDSLPLLLSLQLLLLPSRRGQRALCEMRLVAGVGSHLAVTRGLCVQCIAKLVWWLWSLRTAFYVYCILHTCPSFKVDCSPFYAKVYLNILFICQRILFGLGWASFKVVCLPFYARVYLDILFIWAGLGWAIALLVLNERLILGHRL